MYKKAIASIIVAAGTLWAQADEGDYINISGTENKTSALAKGTDDYRLIKDCILHVDSDFETEYAFRAFGETNTPMSVTLEFDLNTTDNTLYTLSAGSFWAGQQSGTGDWYTTVNITLSSEAQQALGAMDSFTQDILIPTDFFVNESNYTHGSFTLSGITGWVIDEGIQDGATFQVQEGHIALVGYDKQTRGSQEEYTSYSKLAVVTNGKAVPEPSSLLMSLLALLPVAVRRRRQTV